MYVYGAPRIGVLLVSGLIAGLLAYTISSRRVSRESKMAATGPAAVIERAREFGDTEMGRAGREFVSERVVPEMKPVAIELLKEFESYVDRYFRRAEKAIQSM